MKRVVLMSNRPAVSSRYLCFTSLIIAEISAREMRARSSARRPRVTSSQLSVDVCAGRCQARFVRVIMACISPSGRRARMPSPYRRHQSRVLIMQRRDASGRKHVASSWRPRPSKIRSTVRRPALGAHKSPLTVCEKASCQAGERVMPIK